MTDTVKTLREVFEALDDHGFDVKSSMMQRLAEMIDNEEAQPKGNTVLLSAVMSCGGKFSVADQDGRVVAGVKAVACYTDQNGVPVLQITM